MTSNFRQTKPIHKQFIDDNPSQTEQKDNLLPSALKKQLHQSSNSYSVAAFTDRTIDYQR